MVREDMVRAARLATRAQVYAEIGNHAGIPALLDELCDLLEAPSVKSREASAERSQRYRDKKKAEGSASRVTERDAEEGDEAAGGVVVDAAAKEGADIDWDGIRAKHGMKVRA